MSSIDADVNIILNAEDRASPEVASAVKNMNASWRDHLNQQRAVTRSYEIQNKTMFATARAVQAVGSVVNRAISIYNSFTLTQIRLQDAARNSAESIKNYNEAVIRFGEGSPEAIKAQEAMTQILKDQKEAQDQAKLGYALMATSIIADTTRLFTSVLPKLRILRSLTGGAAATAAVSGTSAAVGGATAAGVGSLAGSALRGGLKAAPIAAAVMIASDIQPAYGGPNDKELPGGIDAIGPAVTQIYNFFGTTTDELYKKVKEVSKGVLTFGN